MTHGALSLPRQRPSVLARLLPSGRVLTVAAGIVALGAGAYALARETSMFAVRRVEVVGAPPALSREVEATLARFEGASLVSLDGAGVIDAAENLPTVVSATYDRAFPHTLAVRVVPERRVAVLRSGGSAWLVSARGRVMAEVERRRFARLPRIWLPAGTRIELGAFLSGDAGAAARALRAFVSAGLAPRALWARIRDGRLTVALRSGVELRFGRPTELALKLAVVSRILRTVRPPGAGGPGYVDLSVPERPVAGANTQPSS